MDRYVDFSKYAVASKLEIFIMRHGGIRSKLSAAGRDRLCVCGFLRSGGAGLPLARGVLDEGRPKLAQFERKHGGELDRRAAIDAF